MTYRRRDICGGLVIGLGSVATPLLAVTKTSTAARLAELESHHGGKLGVAILDTSNGRVIVNRGDERFPMCSVIKLPAAAFVLSRVDRGRERLERRVSYAEADLVTYSPVTEKNVGAGMTIAALCEAAITLSDNGAQNLLFDSFGGPSALTAYIRSVGDTVTRSDRRETALNDVPPGDERDTTTPIAMAQLMRRMLAGAMLKPTSRGLLATWLIATKTGDKRLRAGTPAGWRSGDKTGTGPRNATNDVAVFFPPRRAPIVVAAFYIDSPASLEDRQSVLAAVGRLAVTMPYY